MAVALALPCSVVVVEFDVIMCEGLETLVVNVGAVELSDVPHAVPVDTAKPAPGYTVGPVGPVGPVPPVVPVGPVGPVPPAAPVGPVGPLLGVTQDVLPDPSVCNT